MQGRLHPNDPRLSEWRGAKRCIVRLEQGDGLDNRCLDHLTWYGPPAPAGSDLHECLGVGPRVGDTAPHGEIEGPNGLEFGDRPPRLTLNDAVDRLGLEVLLFPDGPECAISRIVGLHYKDRKSTRLNSGHLGISYAVF